MRFIARPDRYDLLMIAIVTLYIFLTPFTKVEESFNVQAMHDIIIHGTSLDNYDHLLFPGAVPRTFITPLLLSIPSAILKRLVPSIPRIVFLYTTRFTLATVNIIALSTLRRTLRGVIALPSLTSRLFAIITLTQFHIPFYISRTLPNILAFPFTNLALAARLQLKPYLSISLLAIATALLRSELSILLLTTILVDVTMQSPLLQCISRAKPRHTHGNNKYTLVFPSIKIALSSAIPVAILSTIVDTVFWGAPIIYPELFVFIYNTFLNKSHLWGTSPFYHYFLWLLPKALAAYYPLSLFAMTWLKPKTLLHIVGPSVGFVMIYSILPHKELRFIFYTLPAFNIAAAVALAHLVEPLFCKGATRATGETQPDAKDMNKKEKQKKPCSNYLLTTRNILRFSFAFITILISVTITIASLYASYYNYPAGYALQQLHHYHDSLPFSQRPINPSVHIDTYSATTGISRFLESDNSNWMYLKDENIVNDMEFYERFDYLITEKYTVKGFNKIGESLGFVGFDREKLWFRNVPRVFLMKRSQRIDAGV